MIRSDAAPYFRKTQPERVLVRGIAGQDPEEVLLWLCGFLGTMPVLTLLGNTLFTWLLLLVCMFGSARILCRRNGAYRFSGLGIPAFFIFGSAAVSAGYCMLTEKLPEEFRGGQSMSLVVELLYLLFFLLYLEEERRGLLRQYLRGVYAATVFQAGYCVLQILIEMLTGQQLNVLLFQSVPYTSAVTGLCWHPSNLAPLFVFGFVYSGQPAIKLLFLALSLFAGSRTVVIGLILCVLLEGSLKLIISKGRLSLGRKAVLVVLGVGLGVLLLIFFMGGWDVLQQKISPLQRRAEEDLSGNIHVYYWRSLPGLIREASGWDLLYPVIGVGIGNSGYVMTRSIGMYQGMRWVLECDYLNDFWNYGIIGFLARYLFYFLHAVRSVRIDLRYGVFLTAFFLMGITYNVLYGWCQLLLYAIILLSAHGEKLR